MEEDAAYWEARQQRYVRGFLIFWLALIVPWIPFAMLAGLAFDGGPRPSAYLYFWAVMTYPITVGIAAFSRKRVPVLVLLPLLNVLGFLGSGVAR